MNAAYFTALALFGLAFGSFANVVIWRFPRGESLSVPGSHCPACGHPVRWYDNIPLVSWGVLRARCRDCGFRISFRYPLVELTSAVLWVLAAVRFGFTLRTVACVVLFYFLLLLTFIDIDTMRLPNLLVGALAITGVVFVAASAVSHTAIAPLLGTSSGSSARPIVVALIGVALGAGPSLGIALVYEVVRKRQGFGMGDVKLLATLGIYLGPYALMTLVIGSFIGAVWGVGASVGSGEGASTKIPFGPFLAAGAVLTVMFGPSMWVWYISIAGLA
ncbi:MAG: prepilin peptidase [Actinomycetota bacterium]|nr:prepilin peptidase [Actinomycetota bacterium]